MNILKEIRNGSYDDQLEDMQAEIIRRNKVRGRIQFAELKTGSKVRFVSNIKPTYLRGMEATVVGKKVSKLIVRLDQPVGRFSGDVRCSPSLVEPVEVA